MNCYRFSELKNGQWGGYCVTVTEKMLEEFCSITNDINPLHIDAKYATGCGFKDRVVYGFLTASFLSTLAGVYLPGKRSIIQEVNMKFAKPVYIGDELTVRGEIIELHNSVRQMSMKVEIQNQDKVNVLRGTMKIGVLDD